MLLKQTSSYSNSKIFIFNILHHHQTTVLLFRSSELGAQIAAEEIPRSFAGELVQTILVVVGAALLHLFQGFLVECSAVFAWLLLVCNQQERSMLLF